MKKNMFVVSWWSSAEPDENVQIQKALNELMEILAKRGIALKVNRDPERQLEAEEETLDKKVPALFYKGAPHTGIKDVLEFIAFVGLTDEGKTQSVQAKLNQKSAPVVEPKMESAE